MNRIVLTTIAILSLFMLNAEEKSIYVKNGDDSSKYHERSLGYSPYVTIDDNDVLRVYGEYSDNVTVVVFKNNNMVWSGYPSSTNNQCQEFTITGLTKGINYTLYLNIDETTYIGEFTK